MKIITSSALHSYSGESALLKLISDVLLWTVPPTHTDEQGLGNQLEAIYNSTVLVQYVAWKTYRVRWTIGTSIRRGLGNSVLAVRHNDDHDHALQKL